MAAALATPRLITGPTDRLADTLVALLRAKIGAEPITQEEELASRLSAAVDCQAALARELAAGQRRPRPRQAPPSRMPPV
jgi:hypothetical protein